MAFDPIEGPLDRMVAESARTSPTDVLQLLDVMCDLLGASAARFFVADYSLRRLQQIDDHGSVGHPREIAGTLIGRVFTTGDVQIVGTDPTVVSVALKEGSCPLGILEFDVDSWDGLARNLLDSIVAVFVMTWIVKGRYTDRAARARRSEPLSAAAEIQWDLLPPLLARHETSRCAASSSPRTTSVETRSITRSMSHASTSRWSTRSATACLPC